MLDNYRTVSYDRIVFDIHRAIYFAVVLCMSGLMLCTSKENSDRTGLFSVRATDREKKMMKNNSDYSAYDQQKVLLFLFHPRNETETHPLPDHARELAIPVDDGASIGGRIYTSSKASPNILFFHGNGEIVADYEDLAPLYNQLGMNFIPVDYRGYGKSTGRPSVSAMMKDSHAIFSYVVDFLKSHGYSGPLIVMGRSLGSASALELASSHGEMIDGLIIESGFAYAVPLLRLLGVDTDSLGITEENGFDNIDKIRKFEKPTLVIHAEYDHIIPFSDGKSLFNASSAKEKKFLRIPNANHNTIFMYGINEYMISVKQLVDSVGKK